MSMVLYNIAVVVTMFGGIATIVVIGLDMFDVLESSLSGRWAILIMGIGAILAMLSYVFRLFGL